MCAMTAPGAPWPVAVIHDIIMRNIGPAPVIYGKFSPAPAQGLSQDFGVPIFGALLI